ncbi:hypothetical protein Mgra_00001058, partial [Meloidogyne graminicola]
YNVLSSVLFCLYTNLLDNTNTKEIIEKNSKINKINTQIIFMTQYYFTMSALENNKEIVAMEMSKHQKVALYREELTRGIAIFLNGRYDIGKALKEKLNKPNIFEQEENILKILNEIKNDLKRNKKENKNNFIDLLLIK